MATQPQEFQSTSTPAMRAAQCRQRGVTILEVMIGLLVVLVVYALVSGKIEMVLGRSDLTEEESNIETLLTNVKDIKTISGYGASGTDLRPTMISRGYVPTNMSVVGGVIYNKWGGVVSISSLGTKVALSYAGVPKQACNSIATKSNKQTISLQVNSGAAVKGEYTAAQAATDCSDDLSNTLTWTTRN